jgi:protein TonB
MFESTLEAQALNSRERRIGTLSAAALAHAAICAAIVAVTAIIVPPVHPPDAPSPVFVIIPRIHLEDLAPRPTLPSEPKKGTDAAKAGRVVVPPRVPPNVPPPTTPDPSPTAPLDIAPAGPDLGGEGVQGVGKGGAIGTDEGTGNGEAGPGDAAAVDPVDLTGDMVRPVLLARVEPSYPQVARRAGLGGRVTVRAVIAEDGSVDTVEVLASTNPLFNEAAVDAVRKWRYRPARMNGRPVRVYFSVVVDFLVR